MGRPVKIFTASLAAETNTFSPIPTGARAFEVTRGGVDAKRATLFSGPVAAWARRAAADGHALVEGLVAGANPGGRVVRPVYEGLRDEILEDLRRAAPVDLILLSLHGAMVAEGYDDCEGDLLARVREIVGEATVIGCLLDPHCVLTARMVARANLVIIFKEWPHTDSLDRAAELYALGCAAAAGRIRPVMAVADCRMLWNYPTVEEPMRGFVERMKAIERAGAALSVSFAHAFIWADVPEMDARMLAITDGDPGAAREIAEGLRAEIWRLRDRIGPAYLDIDVALDRCLEPRQAPVVIADGADGAAGGAPGDSTFLLRRLLDRGVTNAVTGCYWDPVAVLMCQEAGVGATIPLRVGGKLGPTSGDPVDVECVVRGVINEAWQSRPRGIRQNLGAAAWIEVRGVDIVLTTLRVATFSRDAFEQFGIDLTSKRIVVVKSAMHFYPSFAPIASEVLFLAGPGALPMDPGKIAYRKATGPYWPLVADPFARGSRPAGAH
jgi:microcystin degradation protein MlrC